MGALQADKGGVVATPGYGGGMSSAKAALESDTRVLAYEAGRKYSIRVNTISAGPLGSRAAKAIGFIDDMIRRVPAWARARLSMTTQGSLTNCLLCMPYSIPMSGGNPCSLWLDGRFVQKKCAGPDTWKRGRGAVLLRHFDTSCLRTSSCRYSYENAPIQKELQAREVGAAAAFLLSPLASAVTGSTLYVDNGLNAMGLAVDSQTLARKEEPESA